MVAAFANFILKWGSLTWSVGHRPTSLLSELFPLQTVFKHSTEFYNPIKLVKIFFVRFIYLLHVFICENMHVWSSEDRFSPSMGRAARGGGSLRVAGAQPRAQVEFRGRLVAEVQEVRQEPSATLMALSGPVLKL